MKQFTTKQVHHIVSEPGDHTRYDYCVAVNETEFTFMPIGSTFRFPQRLNSYNVQDLSQENINKMAEKLHCNPCTLKECIRTINELIEKENEECPNQQ